MARRYYYLLKIVWVLFIVSFYLPAVFADQSAMPGSDSAAPLVQHEYGNKLLVVGKDYEIIAVVKDDVGVKNVFLYYRIIGDDGYKSALMQKGQDDLYNIILSADELDQPGIEYYILANDTAGNSLLHGNPFAPLVVNYENASVKEKLASGFSGKKKNLNAAENSLWNNKWLWFAVGVVTAAAFSSGGDDNGNSGNSTTTPENSGRTVTIIAAEP